MVENTYEKSLAKVNNSIIGKIKNFFRNFFNKNKKKECYTTQTIIEENNTQINKENLYNSIKINTSKPNLRLEKMSKDLENGEIIEEDLCEQELQELREYYLAKIQEKRQSIENYKNRIMHIKSQLV